MSQAELTQSPSWGPAYIVDRDRKFCGLFAVYLRSLNVQSLEPSRAASSGALQICGLFAVYLRSLNLRSLLYIGHIGDTGLSTRNYYLNMVVKYIAF